MVVAPCCLVVGSLISGEMSSVSIGDDAASSSLIRTTLFFLESDKLKHFLPETIRFIEEGSFVGINDRFLPNKVGFVRFDQLCSFDDFPNDVEWRNEQLHGIVLEERFSRPWQVAGVAIVACNEE